MNRRNFETNAPQRNTLTEFVIDNAPSYETFNAPTLVESEDKFRAAAVEAVNANHIEEELGVGSFYEVHALEGDDRVVVKRLWDGRHDVSQDQLWQRVKRDHQTVVEYLGSKFIPDTEFVALGPEVASDTDSSHARSYIALQERAAGMNLHDLPKDFQPSPELKLAMCEYIVRCEQMMRDGILLDHPDDLMINDTPDATRRVTLLDTNSLARFTDLVAGRNSKVFLEEYNINPASMKMPEDIIQTMYDIVPSILGMEAQEVEVLRGQDYPTLMNRLRKMSGDLSFRLQDALRRTPSNSQSIPPELKDNPFLDELLFSGFNTLASLADRCAPEGQYPHGFVEIMDTFGISTAGLQHVGA